MDTNVVIAIDGPAGSGKSTTARAVAERLGFIYLDTGAMYRSVTLLALREGIEPSDAESLERIARMMDLRFEPGDPRQRVIVNGEDVTADVRSAEVTRAVSEVSAHAGVRSILVERQQQFARDHNLVAEGRDTTSVVFPDAFLKVYLVASVEERARRRVKDFDSLGKSTTLEEQIADIERRDEFDSSRAASPLTRTDDSILLDTTDMTIDGQVDAVIQLYRERAGN